jgi:apolipoprotein N-acyltransferase
MSRRACLIAAFVLGALATAALPPIYLLPLLFVSFGGLLWLVMTSSGWSRAAAVGWLFGFGHFLTGLYWIGLSFLVEAERFGPFAVPAVVGLSAFLALFPAAATALAKLIGGRGAGQVLALAAAWAAMEWLRGHVLTGFPWNLVGYAWTISDATIQLAAVTGIYGLSFLTVVIASLPALVLLSRETGAKRWAAVAVATGLAASLWAGGIVRLAVAGSTEMTDIRLRLVQANVPQAMKWDPAERQRIVSGYLDLSASDGTAPITHLVWPETALPFLLDEEPGLRAAVRTVIPEGGALLTGSVRRGQLAGGEPQLWNSLLALDDTGAVIAAYDKAHLVPFGEYMPLRELLPFKKLTEGTIDFSTGPGRKSVSLPGLPPFSPLICYEIIFPAAVVHEGQRPAWLLNVTNDAWFGDSIGPYQHFAMARVRAVEEGLPLVRAANTGISAVVDSYGRVTASLGLNQTGVVDSPLPQALATPTPYARLRDLPLLAFVAAGFLSALATRRPLTQEKTAR